MVNKKIKTGQLLVVKEDFRYNSGCEGRITIKKNLIVRNTEGDITPKHKDTEISVFTGKTYRTFEVNNLRTLALKERLDAKVRFNKAENWEDESYVD